MSGHFRFWADEGEGGGEYIWKPLEKLDTLGDTIISSACLVETNFYGFFINRVEGQITELRGVTPQV